MEKDSFKTANKKFTFRQKFEIGYRMLMGMGYASVKEEFDVSESYAHELRDFARKILDYLDGHDPDAKVIVLTKELITRIVIALALLCRSPLEGIWRFMRCIFDVNVSVSKASSIINEAARRAEAFDATIPLDTIRQVANDEIFQGKRPVLVGVCVESSYAYLIEPTVDRKGVTWLASLEKPKSHGLNPEVCISDQGSGLLSGVPKAFPDADIQYDVFHELMEITKYRCGKAKYADNLINKESKLQEQVKSHTKGKSKSKLEQHYRETCEKTSRFLAYVDDLSILQGWMRELLGFSGYSEKDSTELMQWVLGLMSEAAENVGENEFAIKMRACKEKLPFLLSHTRRLERLMSDRANELGLPEEALVLLYRLRSYQGDESKEYMAINHRIDELLSGRRPEAEEELQHMLDMIKRASSLVENLNSRIRPYIHLKRIVPDRFFSLMKVFFNTKKYRRSVRSERVSRSPLELMTGKEYPDFFELLGY